MSRLIFLFLTLIMVFNVTRAQKLDFEDWLLYPVLSQNDGPAGNFFTDETQSRPRPVEIEINRDDLVIAGLENAIEQLEAILEDDEFILDENSDVYSYEISNY